MKLVELTGDILVELILYPGALVASILGIYRTNLEVAYITAI